MNSWIGESCVPSAKEQWETEERAYLIKGWHWNIRDAGGISVANLIFPHILQHFVSIKVTFCKTITSQCKFSTDRKDHCKSNKVAVFMSGENSVPKAQFLVEEQSTNKLIPVPCLVQEPSTDKFTDTFTDTLSGGKCCYYLHQPCKKYWPSLNMYNGW